MRFPMGSGRSRALVLAIITASSSMGSVEKAEAEVRYGIANGETVFVDGVPNILARAKSPVGSLLLLPGGTQRLNVGANGTFTDQYLSVFIRNREAFAERGFNVLLIDKETSLTEAVKFMVNLKRPVTIVSTSASTRRVAKALLAGANPDKVILASAMLTNLSGPEQGVADILQNPQLLPPTLVIHHREDSCRYTSPAGVAPFKTWAGDRVREVVWFDGGSETPVGCASLSHHGFGGQDEELVSLVVRFSRASDVVQ